MLQQTHPAHIDFRAVEPVRINWRARVTAYLDAHPGDVANDWKLVEALSVGKPIPIFTGAVERAKQLMNACRDDGQHLSLDGRAALIAVCRARAGQ